MGLSFIKLFDSKRCTVVVLGRVSNVGHTTFSVDAFQAIERVFSGAGV